MIAVNETRYRTELLRKQLLERRRKRGGSAHGQGYEGLDVVRLNSLRDSEGEPSWQLRRGREERAKLQSRTFVDDPFSPLIGRLCAKEHFAKEELERAAEELKSYPANAGQGGHCELDLGRLFELGVKGLLAELRDKASAHTGEERLTLDSFALSLEGLVSLIEEAARVACQMRAECKNGVYGPDSANLRENLERLCASCERLCQGVPVTFQDALQLYWLVWLGTTFCGYVGCLTLGHIDRWAYLYYKQDLAAGRLDPDGALELIETLYLLLNEMGGDGLAYPVMVGGRAPDGKDCTNELSVLCMEALRRTNLVYPTVGIAWNEQTPRELFDLAVELVAKGYSTPAFFGDETIQKGLARYGVPHDECWRFINSTCVEITPCFGSNVWVASPYFPVCAYLREFIAREAAKETDACRDFDDFVERYFLHAESRIRAGVEKQNEWRRHRQAHVRKPLQSVFTRDCIKRARDIDDGGALYNWVECSFVGLANLADSLYVVREEIFSKRTMDFAGLHEILNDDFNGRENERLRFLQSYPKYGQGCAEVDGFVKLAVERFGRICRQFKMEPDDSPFVPGAFCWIMHERLGRECGATPDGRRAGFPFADGCGPAQGREKKGPTAAILSTTSWEHSPMLGGLAMNMKFSRALFAGGDAEENLGQLISTFLKRGGFELQVNVVNNDVLRKAQADPDSYRDLVVRIGGYTDYFTRLSPQMQAEVLLRYEFSEF